jgi:hypothetical protein
LQLPERIVVYELYSGDAADMVSISTTQETVPESYIVLTIYFDIKTVKLF